MLISSRMYAWLDKPLASKLSMYNNICQASHRERLDKASHWLRKLSINIMMTWVEFEDHKRNEFYLENLQMELWRNFIYTSPSKGS